MLKEKRYDAVLKIQEKMNTLKNEAGVLEKLNQPNYMWVTFADGDAVSAMHDLAERARNENYDEERKIMFDFDDSDEKIEFKRADHPSDFKFENR